jgi:hypothetical protein
MTFAEHRKEIFGDKAQKQMKDFLIVTKNSRMSKEQHAPPLTSRDDRIGGHVNSTTEPKVLGAKELISLLQINFIMTGYDMTKCKRWSPHALKIFKTNVARMQKNHPN